MLLSVRARLRMIFRRLLRYSTSTSPTVPSSSSSWKAVEDLNDHRPTGAFDADPGLPKSSTEAEPGGEPSAHDVRVRLPSPLARPSPAQPAARPSPMPH